MQKENKRLCYRKTDELIVVMGTNVRFCRKKKKWSQERLANEAEIDRKTILYLERGVEFPQIGTLQKIAKVLEVSTVDLAQKNFCTEILNRSDYVSVENNILIEHAETTTDENYEKIMADFESRITRYVTARIENEIRERGL